MTDWFDDALAKYPRLAVTGGPRTGKTTLCERIADRPVIHTDDLIAKGWSEASQAAAELFNATSGAVAIEGVAVPRALRKGMRVDAVIWLDRHLVELTRGQKGMTTGCRTVFMEWHAANPHVPVIYPPIGPLKAALPRQEWPKVHE